MLDNIYILTDTELCNRIAAKIKTVRLKQNMSQAELADKSGVSISTIKRMEDGEVKNFESLIRILRTQGKLDIFVARRGGAVEPNEYYRGQQSKQARKRASKGYTKRIRRIGMVDVARVNLYGQPLARYVGTKDMKSHSSV